MSALPELQQAFFNGIFKRDHAIYAHLMANDRLNKEQRFDIYRGSVFGILTTALSEIYPVCKKLVGETFFSAMCEPYIKTHLSNSPNLQNYGKPFAGFLKTFEPVANLPYLPDVARLEWVWHTAFHALDTKPLDYQKLSKLSEEQASQVTFQLSPGSTLLRSTYPVDKVWRANQNEDEQNVIELDDCDCRLIIWRQKHAVSIKSLNESQWKFLNAIQSGQSLIVIVDNYPDLDLQTALSDAMYNGWLAGFTLEDTDQLEAE
ncbi:MAG: DUF2063 domain-containing protein [Gammaproteobacteria bacterium]|nr:MAG: DUF2063 domain-containing protein [Gammaproteobacteria bacterium]